MKKIIAKFAFAVLAASMIAAPCFLNAETPKELLTRLKAKSEAIKSWEMKMESSTKSQYVESSGTISTISKRDGDTVKSYSEMTSETKIPGMPQPQKNVSKMVSDGKTFWIETKIGDQVTVMKSPATTDPTSLAAIEELLDDGKWEVKPKEAVDGEDCDVLSYTVGEGDQAITTTYWLSDKTGHPKKIVAGGGPMGSNITKVTSFKENPVIDESKFSYTPPAGANVMDAGAMGGMMGGAPKKTNAPKAAAPKLEMAPK